MKDHFLYPLFSKLRPQEAKLDDQRITQPFIEFFTLIYLSPFALIALIWLFAVSDFGKFSQDPRGFIVLFASLLIIQSKTASLPLKLSTTSQTQITISLGSILVWVGLFIWGPVALIVDLIINIIQQGYEGWKRSRYQQNAVWMSVSTMLQTLTNSTLAGLIGITIYTYVGGKIPLDGLTFAEWIPAFVAIIVSAFFPAVVMLPVIIQINKVTNVPNTWASLSTFIFTVVQIILIATPFAIPFTLLYTRASPAINIFATIGLVLVNLLLYYLARTNQRSRQRTREMTHLEALGEEIILAPADGSTLKKILTKHIGAMFQDPRDILEVRIFPEVDLPGFEGGAETLNFVSPPYRAASPDAFWEELQKTDEPHLIFKDVIPEGTKAIYGDAVIDKITSATPASLYRGCIFVASQVRGKIH